MKKALNILLFTTLIYSCSGNDFINTEMYFETNKETYLVGDKFTLTHVVQPNKNNQTIRFYKNFSNLSISFLSDNDLNGFELKKTFVEGPSIFGNDDDFIDEYLISKEKPFKKTFQGSITEQNDKIKIEIPSLNISYNTYSTLAKKTKVIIEGNCQTVYSSSFEDITSKTINILIE